MCLLIIIVSNYLQIYSPKNCFNKYAILTLTTCDVTKSRATVASRVGLGPLNTEPFLNHLFKCEWLNHDMRYYNSMLFFTF